MKTMELQCNYPCSYVGIPAIFIDQYMADANGEFVKVYLCLLRHMYALGTGVSISAIADSLDTTEKDVLRALKYWDKIGVITLTLDSDKQPCRLCLNDLGQLATANAADTTPKATEVVSPAAVDTVADTVSANVESKREYTADEIKAFCCNDEIAELLFIIETYLKHPLNSVEMNAIFYWYDGLKFSRELIEYLVEYCITNGHSSLRYMDKVAIGWAENSIDTIQKAKSHVSIRSKAYYAVVKAFGISGRNLAESENAFVSKWTGDYGFDVEMIQEACKRTISATQKASFEYADSILTNWHTNGVHNLKALEASDEAYSKTKRSNTTKTTVAAKKNKFNNFHQRNYDPEEMEKLLLNTSV